ncbi:uncharacterized protein LOC118465003 isoform X2 [Anopheles albimanus]|uniref:uncharacterized protein LOC118465003 isoform X2 n=1 Tax=Anopheles albimanus TaxID=7167 RepID=UPI00163FF3C0|nr:uncharacterized protein LOC118465003 isoform X2 [Anopheles albimanus]
MLEMKDETRKKCFAQEGKQISVCINTYTRSVLWNFLLPNMELPIIQWNYEVTQDKCGTLTSYRQCLKEPLDACDLSDLISIYDVPMNAMLSLTPCANNKEELKVETHQNNSTDEI